ncbi:peptidoglycan-binding domain-containing protein [Microbacterium sp. Leaf159]|uniref:peptidoglycan-binding domain-containing protein n=1 Tax=unclassified Microbacterium TaxID=2609290 RepID=UPI0012F89424|nr:peptidoglycan-binding domain-containing protein [Microbacterium sp. Leaf159]
MSPRLYASGVVRAFDCVPESPWISGDSNITIDDRTLRNLVLPTPPWRSLRVDDRGDDVQELQEALRGLGYAIDADGVFGQHSLEAWRAFTNNPKAETAALEDFVWVPSNFVSSKCELILGDSVTGPMSPASGDATVARFSIVGTIPDATSERVVVVGSERVSASGSVISDPSAIATLMEQPVVIAALETEDAAVAATLELVTPVEAARVSAAAIITDGDEVCVAHGATTYGITIIDSALGRTIVTFDGEVPREVDLDRRINRC